MKQHRSGLVALRRDPVIIGAALWALAGCVALFALAGQANRQVQVFWLLQAPMDLLMAYTSWRVFRLAAGAARRFWAVLAVAAGLWTVGDTAQAVIALRGHDQWSTVGGTVQSALFALGVIALIVVMLIHPMPGRTRREMVAFWLDATTVLIGGAVVAWCFTVGPDPQGDVVSILATGAVILTSGFAAVKLVLSGNAPMHRVAATPMVVSAAVNTFGFFLAPGADGPMPAYVYVVRFLPSMLLLIGPRLQEIVVRETNAAVFGSRRRKPYSLLPYGSIAVAFTSVLVILPAGPDARLWGAITGLGLIFALVVCRQIATFHDNTRLIDQLDATLAELREHEEQLRRQAQTDGLTGLANRTHFYDEVARSLTRPGLTSVLIIDLDGFKAVNDTLGHAAGDALLIGVGDKLRGSVRPGDLVARLGGDEFAVLLHDCAGGDAVPTAERFLRELAAPVPFEDTAVSANASIGIACAAPGDDVSTLLRGADLAMYAAKHDGKGRWRLGLSAQPVT
ncbi:GGDEF domain-containing protein [Paractinoplanes lichenicola]|uniref:GGDEF domain-containing protein n=1 Tax=Paractinoplanes lichenicola TaxID=2802976 RepID=A0ABS1VW49_9ACTN|nr:GGDEF domain-containing protein [Actinoplanes lichenicola]MBL7258712.1 GGDEF domain-containing protein [Actinoplanes lichenicola]